ncbi:MAG: hypothetical protein J6Y78_10785 [Paludibacteraceae bacterium]|nr:hypothetical protein [Paludibacteraceae bacterium]
MAGKQICKDMQFKHCTQCEHFDETSDPNGWVRCKKYGVHSPTIIELQTSTYGEYEE